MSCPPGVTSPPKSGCRERLDPMNEMYAADCGSMGALEMSVFHQLSGGKIGSGPGIGPPTVDVPATMTDAAAMMAAAKVARRTSRAASARPARGPDMLRLQQCVRQGSAPVFSNVCCLRANDFVARCSDS